MSTGAALIGLILGIVILIAGGGALTMLWLAWVYESFELLAPLGFIDSVIGFALTGFLASLVFGTGKGN